MILVFQPVGTSSSDREIKNTDFQKYYPQVNATLPHAAVEPYIRNATSKYVVKWIGPELYEALATHINDHLSNEVLDKLKDPLLTAIANYTIYLAMPSMTAKMSGMGIVQESNDNTTTSSQWTYKTKRWDALQQADTAMDELLKVIDDNIEETELAAYKNSQAYKMQRTTFFSRAGTFQNYSRISGHRAYAALLPDIRKAERKLKHILCSEWPTAINDTTDEVILDFQELCKSYIADTTMLLAVDKTSMTFDGNGWMLCSSTDGYDSKMNIQATFAPGGTEQLKEQLMEDINTTVEDISALLYSHPEVFTLWHADHIDSPDTTNIIVSDDRIGGIML